MAWLTQVFILWVSVSVVTCHGFFGQHHHHLHHHLSELPQVISSIIKEHLGNGFYQNQYGNNKPQLLGDGGYQLGIDKNKNPQGSNLDFNFKPSNIFGDLFGSQELFGHGNDGSSSMESQVPSDEGSFMQNPGDFTGSIRPSVEIYDASHIPDSGIHIDIHIPNGSNNESQGDNGGNLNTNTNENPSQSNLHDASTLENINTGVNGNNGIENGNDSDLSVVQSGQPGEATNINGQGLSVPDIVGADGNITMMMNENKQNTNVSIGEKLKANINLNLNVPGDVHVNVPSSLNSQNTGAEVGTLDQKNVTLDINKPEGQISNSDLAIGIEGHKSSPESAPLNVPGDVHVNVPSSLNSQNTGAEVGTLDQKNVTLDINKPEGQISNSDLAIGVEGHKSSPESAPFQNIDNSKVEGEVHTNNLDKNYKQSLNDTKESVGGLQLAKENDIIQDGKLKTNVIVDSGYGDLDIAFNKRRDKHSIVFPDKLKEAKEKIQKEKINVNNMGASQLPNKLSDRNDIVNGQFLYAVNIAPALTSSASQGSYVPPATSRSTGQQTTYVPSNIQNVPITGSTQSGTPIQYVVQNPSNAGSNIAPNSNVVYTSPGVATSSNVAYMSPGVATSSNVAYTSPGVATSSGYAAVNVPNSGNTPGQVLYTLPASYGQGSQPNGYYQVNNNQSPQLYYTVQLSNGQTALVPVSSSQTYTTGLNNGQGPVMVPSNSQQYVVSNGQPIQGNGQILVSSNGQQYIPSNGNGQVFVGSDGQQYIPANSQPGQGNAQIVVPSNSQQYIQSQPANTPIMVASNGQNYLPSGQVSVPWNGGQSAVQNGGQVYVPLNQNPQNNMVAIPSGSIVNVGGDSHSVPLMVVQGFKDKAEPSLSSDEKLDQSKDKIDDDTSYVTSKNIEH